MSPREDLRARSLRPFGTSIFSEMTRLAEEQGAINLAQGFPDFDGPPWLIEAAVQALRGGANQYARSMGRLDLTRAIARRTRDLYGLDYDPDREVAVASGATEVIASAILGLIDPGDEVVLFEPVYDSYPACVAMAGGVARYVTLRFPRFQLDPRDLEARIGPQTKLIVLNSPHNPTGKVFSREELAAIAAIAVRHDLLVLTDEVYEHLTYGSAAHVPIATFPGMRERTLRVSSAAKTFSVTGWKVGWASGPERLVRALQAAHQFVTFATATPLQAAVAAALGDGFEEYVARLRTEYAERRDFLAAVLRRAGFDIFEPEGAFFVIAGISSLSDDDDLAFARRLVMERGVASIPPSAFYIERPQEGRRLIRFAFCKRMETLRAAAARLEGLGRP